MTAVPEPVSTKSHSKLRPAGRVRRPAFGRSRIAAAVTAVLIGSMAVGVVSASGDPVRQIRANDAAVWEIDRSTGRASHWNTSLDVIGSAIRVARDPQMSIEQEHGGVVIVDRSNQSLRVLDDRELKLIDSQLKISNDAIVRISAKSLWIVESAAGRLIRVPAAALATATTLDPYVILQSPKPVSGELGADGTFHLLVPSTGDMRSYDDAGVQRRTTNLGGVNPNSQISAIGATPVVLDPQSNELIVAGKGAPKRTQLGKPGLLLAMPTMYSRYLVVADRSGTIAAASLSSGALTELVANVGPLPIRPLVTINGCVLGASQSIGLVASVCPDGTPVLKPNVFEAAHELQGRIVRSTPIVDDLESRRVVALRANGDVAALDANAQDRQSADAAGEKGNDRSTDPTNKDAENRPPQAVDDQLRVRPDRSTLLPVLLNDLDSAGEDLFVSSVSGLPTAQPLGTVGVAVGGAGVVFRPLPGFTGAASFQYVVSDSAGQTDVGNVEIIVDDVRNEAPVAGADVASATAGRESLIDALANDRDPDGDQLSITTAQLESGDGKVSVGRDGLVAFESQTPGTAVIRYGVQDERGLSSVGTVAVTVSGNPNQAPIARDDTFEVVRGQTTSIDVLSNDLDPDGSLLVLASVPTDVAPIATLQRDGNQIRVNPTQSGTQRFSYSVTDGQTTATAQVRLVVRDSSGNRSPIAAPDRVVMAAATSTTLNVVANDVDPDGDVIGVVSWTTPDGIDITTSDSKKLTITMSAKVTKPVVVVYQLSDGTEPVPGTLLVTPIAAVENLAPFAVSDHFGVRSGAGRSLDVLGNDADPEGLPLIITKLIDAPVGITIAAGGRQILVDGSASTRPVNFDYEMVDQGGLAARAKVELESISDPNFNRSPILRVDQAVVRAGDAAIIPVTANDDDPDGDTLQLVDVGLPQKGSAQIFDGQLKYTSSIGGTGTDRFFYSVDDGHGGKVTQEVTVGVLPAPIRNRPPIAVNDGPKRVSVGETTTADVLANDYDPDGDRIRLVFVEKASSGVAAIVDGRLVFTAAVPGAVTVRYSITDSAGSSATATISFDVVAGKRNGIAPIARVDVATAQEVGARVLVDVLANDDDADGDPSKLTVIKIEGGQATIARNGRSIEMVAGPQRNVVTYTVADPQGNVASSTVTLTVNKLVELTVRDDTARVSRGSSVDIEVLSNDTVDQSRAPLRVLRVSTPQSGSASSVAGARVRYTPDVATTGTISFGYTVADSAGNEKSGTVRVEVVDGLVKNRAPITRAGGPIMLTPGNTGTIDLASLASDPDGQRLLYSLAGTPAEVSTKVTVSILSITAGNISNDWRGNISFTVTDPDGLTSTNQIEVRINLPVAPTAAPPTTVVVTPTPTIAPAAITRQNSPTTAVSFVAVTTQPSPATIATPAGSVTPVIPTTLRQPAIQTTIQTTNQTTASLAPKSGGSESTSSLTSAPNGSNPATTINTPGVSAATSVATQTTVASQTTVLTQTTKGPLSSVVQTVLAGSTTIPNQTGVLGAPGKPTVVITGPTTAEQSWPAVAGATSYQVSLNGGPWAGQSTGTVYFWSGLTPGTTYGFVVRACDASSCGPLSDATSATTTGTAPGGPTTVAVTTIIATSVIPSALPAMPAPSVRITGQTTADQSWAVVAGATSYQVSLNGGAWVGVTSGTTYGWSGLTPGTAYGFSVRGCNASACGPVSPQTFATTAPITLAPTTATPTTVPPTTVAPTTVPPTTVPPTTVAPSLIVGPPAAQAQGQQSIALSWTGSYLLRYEVQIDGAAIVSAGYGVVGSPSLYEWKGLTPGTTYSFALRACDATTCGPWSSQTSATTSALIISTMAAPAVVITGQTTANESWPAQSGATSYEVSLNGGTSIAVGNVTSYAWTGLTAGTAYGFAVRSCNAAGCGSMSAQTFATTTAPPTTVPPTTAPPTTAPPTTAPPTTAPPTTAPPTTAAPGGTTPPGIVPQLNYSAISGTFSWGGLLDFGSAGGTNAFYEVSVNGSVVFSGVAFNYSVPKPAEGNTVNMSVRACTTAGCGPSNGTSYTTLTPRPAAPGTPVFGTNIVSWVGNGGDYYVLTFNGTQSNVGVSFSYAFTSVSGQTYTASVSACNAGGCTTSGVGTFTYP
jgi:large repetitive protein